MPDGSDLMFWRLKVFIERETNHVPPDTVIFKCTDQSALWTWIIICSAVYNNDSETEEGVWGKSCSQVATGEFKCRNQLTVGGPKYQGLMALARSRLTVEKYNKEYRENILPFCNCIYKKSYNVWCLSYCMPPQNRCEHEVLYESMLSAGKRWLQIKLFPSCMRIL